MATGLDDFQNKAALIDRTWHMSQLPALELLIDIVQKSTLAL